MLKLSVFSKCYQYGSIRIRQRRLHKNISLLPEVALIDASFGGRSCMYGTISNNTKGCKGYKEITSGGLDSCDCGECEKGRRIFKKLGKQMKEIPTKVQVGTFIVRIGCVRLPIDSWIKYYKLIAEYECISKKQSEKYLHNIYLMGCLLSQLKEKKK